MNDGKGRVIDYLRISVTDRCNLRCVYCMPEEGIPLSGHNEILSFDEIVAFTKVAVANGVTKVRLTGGEPLVRRGVENLVKSLSQIEGIKDLAMTTNGVLLKQFAPLLKEAGLMRVNISLDTVDKKRYREITRGGELNHVFSGIEAALKEGLTPVKINCVIDASPNEEDAKGVALFAQRYGCQVRFIPRMDLEKGIFGIVHGGTGGDCPNCNRLRLTTFGKLKPCLFSDIEVDIRELGYEQALKTALNLKPVKGEHSIKGRFYNIGG